MKWVPTILCVAILFGLVTSHVETDPKLQTNSVSIFQRVTWSAQECARCPYGYQCYYNAWLPSLTLNGPVWVFGITNNTSTGGILHFREYPDDPCRISCQDFIPVLYTAEVVYVPSYGGAYAPGKVPITYIPKGQYVVTSPSFPIQYNMRLWYFPDDGNGPELMDAVLKTDKEKYGREDTSVIFSVQVTDEETNQFIQVDSVFGEIILPDSTRKTVEPADWTWNEDEERHEYTWDFTDDDGLCADPKEGFYSAEMTVKKKYYKDVTVYTDFDVCYHINMSLEFNRNPPEYELGELVEMTIHVTDETGVPVIAGMESMMILPDGRTIPDLPWTQTNPGTYIVSYVPRQPGNYSITARMTEDSVCYLEDINSVFFVKSCDEALINLEIHNTVLDELTTLVLTITDGDNNPLSGADIASDLYHLDEYVATLVWTDQGGGIYTAEYTPTNEGLHTICGTVLVLDEAGCFSNFFQGYFTVEERLLPDLVIRNEDITIYPDPKTHDFVEILVRIWNMGKKDAGEFQVIVLIDGEELDSYSVEGLAAGESITIKFTWYVEHSGAYVISAIVDPWEMVV